MAIFSKEVHLFIAMDLNLNLSKFILLKKMSFHGPILLKIFLLKLTVTESIAKINLIMAIKMEFNQDFDMITAKLFNIIEVIKKYSNLTENLP